MSFLPRIPVSPTTGGKHDDDDAESRKQRMQDPVRLGVVKVKRCGLCGLEFEEMNLPGVVSYQAIAQQREAWGAPFPQDSARMHSASSQYSSVKLCAFCYQFFYDTPENGAARSPGSRGDRAATGTGSAQGRLSSGMTSDPFRASLNSE